MIVTRIVMLLLMMVDVINVMFGCCDCSVAVDHGDWYGYIAVNGCCTLRMILMT